MLNHEEISDDKDVQHPLSIAQLLPPLAVVLCAFLFFSGPRLKAQDTETSLQERNAAAEAYDKATAAYLATDYAEAAKWFETANRLAHAKAALAGAIRSHDRAGNKQRAASLALQLESEAEFGPLLVWGRSTLGWVRVTCDSKCSIEVDGTLEDLRTFFVTPGSHAVVAGFDTGEQDETFEIEAGASKELTFIAPEYIPEEWKTVMVEEGLPNWLGFSMVGLSAVTTGFFVWSLLDTLDSSSTYQKDPTTLRLNDGRDREMRSWILLGASVAMIASTTLLAFHVDWDGPEEQRVRVSSFGNVRRLQMNVGLQDNGLSLNLGGRF